MFTGMNEHQERGLELTTESSCESSLNQSEENSDDEF